jgi:uncharacterized protein YndB with AHSA1/START domain
MTKFTAAASVSIKATTKEVWQAVTDPVLVKQWMFGTTLITDWKKGSPVLYRGEWEGKPYEDKGVILDIEPLHMIKTSYFSPLSGEADTQDNYTVITYRMTDKGDHTEVAITQEDNKTQEAADSMTGNWKSVLAELKKMLEN